MFGNMFDIEKMLNGGEGGGGNPIMNMLIKQLASPKMQKMIAGKVDDMFDFLAGQVKADKNKVQLLLKLETVPVKDENGNIVLEQPGSANGSANLPSTAIQKTEQKAIIYVLVDGKAVQKIAIDQFLAMMQEQGG